MFLNDGSNPEFKLALEFINNTNHPVFLTGKAGTGKTTFLRYIKENSPKNTAVVAPTGVAAMNAGGTTIHSFFQLPFTPFLPTIDMFNNVEVNNKHNLLSTLRINAERKEVLQKLELLVIDEISMVRADVLDAIDLVLRHVRGKHRLPFGGVQVLYIGDMYQLPPVIKQEELQLLKTAYNGFYFFCSKVISEQPPVYIELNKVYRQRDELFIHLLNQVRNNNLTEESYELLHTRYNPLYNSESNDDTITLTTHNAKADNINGKRLADIQQKEHAFKADIEGSFFESAFPADEMFKVKEGAQVMFIKNDTEKLRRYFNGKIGRVHKIEEDKIWVEVYNNGERNLLEIRKETWRNIKYTLNRSSGKIEEEETGSFIQYPLRLAWAITIHKSQGLTFENAVIDAAAAFSPGQVYVALSRCTNLNGLTLMSKISYNSLQSDPAIVKFAKQQQSAADTSVLLETVKHQYEADCICSLFDFNNTNKVLSEYISWLNENIHRDITSWKTELTVSCNNLVSTGNKFQQQLRQLITGDKIPEIVQQRIIAAVEYFPKPLIQIKEVIQKCPVITDNRQLAADHDEKLQMLYEGLHFQEYQISNCKEGFHLDKFLEIRFAYKKTPLSFSSYSGKSVSVPADVQHPDLYRLLRNKRDDLCKRLNLEVYRVCSSDSIAQMCASLPTTLHALGNVAGFGKIKLKQFGKQFIDIIAAYTVEHGLQSNRNVLPVKKERKPKNLNKPDTKLLSFELYKSGKSIDQIASERNFTPTTIEGHLAHFVSEGKLNAEELITAEKIKVIEQAKKTSGTESITSLKGMLPEISYGELRIFLAAEKFKHGGDLSTAEVIL